MSEDEINIPSRAAPPPPPGAAPCGDDGAPRTRAPSRPLPPPPVGDTDIPEYSRTCDPAPEQPDRRRGCAVASEERHLSLTPFCVCIVVFPRRVWSFSRAPRHQTALCGSGVHEKIVIVVDVVGRRGNELEESAAEGIVGRYAIALSSVSLSRYSQSLAHSARACPFSRAHHSSVVFH